MAAYDVLDASRLIDAGRWTEIQMEAYSFFLGGIRNLGWDEQSWGLRSAEGMRRAEGMGTCW